MILRPCVRIQHQSMYDFYDPAAVHFEQSFGYWQNLLDCWHTPFVTACELLQLGRIGDICAITRCHYMGRGQCQIDSFEHCLSTSKLSLAYMLVYIHDSQ